MVIVLILIIGLIIGAGIISLDYLKKHIHFTPKINIMIRSSFPMLCFSLLIFSLKFGLGVSIVIISVIFGAVIMYYIPKQYMLYRLKKKYKLFAVLVLEFVLLVSLFVVDYKLIDETLRTIIHIFAYLLLEI